MVGGTMHPVQMMVYPIDEDFYIILLDELDISLNREEDMTIKKVDTIQNIYLFSMYIDLIKGCGKRWKQKPLKRLERSPAASVSRRSGRVMVLTVLLSAWITRCIRLRQRDATA